jgi:hypothetical protein
MITEIPGATDFARASVNLLHLAWETAVADLRTFVSEHAVYQEEPRLWSPEEVLQAAKFFWNFSQPGLSNALTLIEQAIEMALKGRVASVSPFLLIANDARDYPSGSDKTDVPFSAFRTIDAADLLRVHNSVFSVRLGDDFKTYWDSIRRQRNLIIHSVATEPCIDAKDILTHVLVANEFLHGEQSWPRRRLAYSDLEEYTAAFPQMDNYTHGFVLDEMALVIRNLSPSIVKKYFGFDKRSRAYICVHCYEAVDRKLQREVMPHLAQLRPRATGSKSLYCSMCEKTTAVLRQRCQADGCPSNVLGDEPGWFGGRRGMCLVCQADNAIG